MIIIQLLLRRGSVGGIIFQLVLMEEVLRHLGTCGLQHIALGCRVFSIARSPNSLTPKS